MAPNVSILMSIYNGGRHLRESVESLLAQTFTDFECILIDDGSSDETWAVLCEYGRQDQRVRLLKNAINIGLTNSLNKGLALTKGTYIARQDADDISLPERLEKQVRYLESHPEVALVGSGVQYIDEAGNNLGRYFPPTHTVLLRWSFLFKNPVRHPTVLWRRELIKTRIGGYDPAFIYAQDYDFWVRIADEHLSIEVLPAILVKMRWHEASISLSQRQAQNAFAVRVSHKQFGHYLADEVFTEEEAANLKVMPRRKDPYQLQFFYQLRPLQVKHAAYCYIKIGRKFCETQTSVKSPEAISVVRQEVEDDLIALLQYCKHRRWFTIGLLVILRYLHEMPGRIFFLARRICFVSRRSSNTNVLDIPGKDPS